MLLLTVPGNSVNLYSHNSRNQGYVDCQRGTKADILREQYSIASAFLKFSEWQIFTKHVHELASNKNIQ